MVCITNLVSSTYQYYEWKVLIKNWLWNSQLVLKIHAITINGKYALVIISLDEIVHDS